ncbi:MAG: PAS domain S-box protein [Rhodospirillaceae bacterium]
MSHVTRDMAIEMVNRSPAHVILIDKDNYIIDVNQRAESLLMQKAEVLVGGHPTDVFAAILGRVTSIGEERAERGFQLQYGPYWYEAQVFPTSDSTSADGAVFRVIRAIDITDRKAAEFELLESEARLEEATRIARMGTYRLYWDTRKMIWSHQMYEIHGVAPGSIDPSSPSYIKFLHPDDVNVVRDMMDDLIVGKEISGAEYRIIRGEGDIRWLSVEGRVLFDSDGKPYASFGTVQDVTESKNREERLRDLVARNTILTEALQASPVGVAVLTPDLERPTFFYVNPELETITGFSEGYLIGSSVEVLRGPETDASGFQDLLDAIQSRLLLSCELTLHGEGGTPFLSQIELAPVTAQDRTSVVGLTLIVRDITDDRRRTEAMMDAQKMEALGKLSGGVAHEINNLLQPIITLSDLGFEACAPDQDKLRKYFEVITGSGRKARDVVRQILTFSRQDAPLVASHSVAPIVEDAVKLARSGIPPGIDLQCNIDVQEACAMVNPTQVSQVVINLVRNAADAMAGQGLVDLSLVRLSPEQIITSAVPHRHNGWLLLSVSDTGCGIDNQSRHRIFEPFFTTKPVGQGTGLGLSVVYSIVLGWGGAVSLESEVDQGTTAMVYIPEYVEAIDSTNDMESPR